VLASNLSDLKNNLGIQSTTKYSFREGYNINKFIDDYRAFKGKLDAINKYSDFARDGFAELRKYVDIMQLVFDDIMVARNASSKPDTINKDNIKSIIDKGDYRRAINELHIKLEYVLVKKLGKESTAENMINLAKKENILSDNIANILHELRKFRNKLQHPTQEQLAFDKAKITKWADAVFSITENHKGGKK
jgi:hypothetical protein